jgi:hypothetical protein
MWYYIVGPDRPHMTICHMRVVCWVSKATNTYLEYAKIIVFRLNNSLTNVSYCYVVRTLPCLYISP